MKKIGITILAFSILFGYQAQEKLTNKEGSEYEFKILKELEANPVQNQNRTFIKTFFSFFLNYF